MVFHTGSHADWHEVTDHADKLDYARMRKVTRLVYDAVEQVAFGAVTPRMVHPDPGAPLPPKRWDEAGNNGL